MIDDNAGNVIRMRDAMAQPATRGRDGQLGRVCKHWNATTTVKEDTRTCVCACGAVRDPIDVLLDIANHWDNWKFKREQTKREIDRLGLELEDIKRQVRNAKAALRRAQTTQEVDRCSN